MKCPHDRAAAAARGGVGRLRTARGVHPHTPRACRAAHQDPQAPAAAGRRHPVLDAAPVCGRGVRLRPHRADGGDRRPCTGRGGPARHRVDDAARAGRHRPPAALPGLDLHRRRTDRLLKSLKHARLDHTVEQEMRRLIGVDLLLLDDFGLDAMDPPRAATSTSSSSSGIGRDRSSSPPTAGPTNGSPPSRTRCGRNRPWLAFPALRFSYA